MKAHRLFATELESNPRTTNCRVRASSVKRFGGSQYRGDLRMRTVVQTSFLRNRQSPANTLSTRLRLLAI